MNALLGSGYLYELAGIAYYVLFLAMSRPRNAGRFSRRSLTLTLLAGIALVAAVPLHYAASAPAVGAVAALAVAALVSTAVDARRRPR